MLNVLLTGILSNPVIVRWEEKITRKCVIKILFLLSDRTNKFFLESEKLVLPFAVDNGRWGKAALRFLFKRPEKVCCCLRREKIIFPLLF